MIHVLPMHFVRVAHTYSLERHPCLTDSLGCVFSVGYRWLSLYDTCFCVISPIIAKLMVKHRRFVRVKKKNVRTHEELWGSVVRDDDKVSERIVEVPLQEVIMLLRLEAS